jgi:fructoselysine 6-kinase
MVKIAAMGDNVVDCYLARNEMYPGGNCLNVAVHASRFGAQSAYVGAVGRDRGGDLIHAVLTAERVGVERLRRLEGPTAYCLIGHRDADRVFMDFNVGVSMFTPVQDDLDFLSGFDAVHVGQSSGLDAWVSEVSCRTLLSYDFSTRREPEHRKAVGPCCFLASVSGDGLSEAELDAIGSELLAAGSRWVLLTRGRAGAVLYNTAGCYSAQAHHIEAVDTLGAGDTFIARMLVGLLREEAPDDALACAAEAAAATCSYNGAIGYPLAIDIGTDTAAIIGRARELAGESRPLCSRRRQRLTSGSGDVRK